jgi:diadenylate cyclase
VSLDLLSGMLPPFRWQDALDILIMAVVFYNLILLLRGTRTVQMLVGLGVLMAASSAAGAVGLRAVGWVLQNFLGAVVIVVIILFQPELRRALANVGRAPLLRFFDPIKEARVLQELVRGTQDLAARRVGALIALQREADLTSFVEGGVAFDALVTRELLFSIFLPSSPVHDGAVLVRGNRLSHAGCFLPLSQNPDLPKGLGTRHRAALGLSEETDAVVIVVSEETGAVSLAAGGELQRDLDAAGLQGELDRIFHPRDAEGGA